MTVENLLTQNFLYYDLYGFICCYNKEKWLLYEVKCLPLLTLQSHIRFVKSLYVRDIHDVLPTHV